ncbi:hypothetical protein LCGC14_2626760, partial [marine sediment metagenome]
MGIGQYVFTDIIGTLVIIWVQKYLHGCVKDVVINIQNSGINLHPFLKGRPIVPPSGPRENVLLAGVGEQPGVEEVRNGKVFFGPAGKELDVDFRMAGIARKDVYLTNLFKDLSHPLKYYMKIPSKLNQPITYNEEGL